MDMYSVITDIEYILEKRLANNLEDAMKLDDIYLTLSQCAEIEKEDIDRKVTEIINKK